MPSPEYIRRRVLRHLLLGAASVAMVLFVYVNVPTDFILRKWNLATAYVSLAFFALSLLIGPWNVLRSRGNPVSIDLRRDVGIWAGLLAVLHSGIGLFIHKMGGPARYFFYGPDEPHRVPWRTDLFGLANYTGLGSTLLLLMLLAISNDISLRRLGTPRWKSLQRWNYAAFALMAVHAVAYQVLSKRVLPVVVVFAGVILCVLATQLAGLQRRRAEAR